MDESSNGRRTKHIRKRLILAVFRLVLAVSFVVFSGLVTRYILENLLVIVLTNSLDHRVLVRTIEPTQIERWQYVMFHVSPDDSHVPSPETNTLTKRVLCLPEERVKRVGLHYWCETKEGDLIPMGMIKFRARDGKPLKPWVEDGEWKTIPRDSYFVLGKPVPESYDSRYFGPVKKEQICGFMQPLF